MKKHPEIFQILKMVLVLFLIIGLLFACGLLYLNSFIKRLRASEMASSPTESVVQPIDTEGWNSIDMEGN